MNSKIKLNSHDNGLLFVKGNFTLEQLTPFFGKDSQVLTVEFKKITFTDQSFKELFEFFSIKSRMEFTFVRCQLDDRKIKILTDFFYNLWGLHIVKNELSAESFVVLAEALRDNKTIKFFTFGQAPSVDLPVSTFLEKMGSNRKLESVSLISSETTISKDAQEVLWGSNIRSIHAHKMGLITFTYPASWDTIITIRDSRRMTLQERCAILIRKKRLDCSTLSKMVLETNQLEEPWFL